MSAATTEVVRVLIADDEASIRHMLELHLRREGYEVVSVGDGLAAFEALCPGGFDFALCDLVMPGLDGLALLERLAEAKVETPVVLMSAHADLQTAIKAMDRGAFDYVAKPFHHSEVLFRLHRALERRALSREVRRLKAEVGGSVGFEEIIANSKVMAQVFRLVRKVAGFKTTVLLTGESGTGKELVARAIHRQSPRSERPFIPINCGAIPEALLESELFGHAKGAFTDARRARRGLFEEADGGTIFLDEVGELPMALQVKLLRVLQEGEIRRVGEALTTPVDVRVIAATVADLPAAIVAHRFREDLFYRLNVLQIALPPLRARGSDVPLLVDHFIERFNERLGRAVEGLDAATLKLLVRYQWPGNVRELQNAIERAMVLAEGTLLTPEDLPERVRSDARGLMSMVLGGDELSIKRATRIIEETLIRRALKRTDGNRTQAARHLEISHRTLLYKLKAYGI